MYEMNVRPFASQWDEACASSGASNKGKPVGFWDLKQTCLPMVEESGFAPCELDLDPDRGAKAASSSFEPEDPAKERGRCSLPRATVFWRRYGESLTLSKLQFCLLGEARNPATLWFCCKNMFKTPGVRSKHVI
ncbi:hypothetical protein MHYP_G00306160 [Metynnis hypsauchen]